MAMLSRKRTLSFLMCYVLLTTAMYVVSLWLASDIHIRQILTVESRQVIIQNSGNAVEHGQSEVVVKTKTNGKIQKYIVKEAAKTDPSPENNGPKYSLKLMTAMKKMEDKSSSLKEVQNLKKPRKEGPVDKKGARNNKNDAKKVVTGAKNSASGDLKGKTEKEVHNIKNKPNVNPKGNAKGGIDKGKTQEQGKKGNKTKKDTGKKEIKEGKQEKKDDVKKEQTKLPPTPKPKKEEPPVPELIYGLFRKPRLDQLDTSVQIPHIVHQTWKETLLPLSLKPFLQSWKKYNPTWEYWFWTDADARLLVQTRFPDLLGMYDKFEKAVQRADVIRYFILYEFGGVYADLDVEALRPLDNFTKPHHCIISNEPLLHTYLIWRKDRLPCNAFMASIPKHPFFKFLITRLPVYDRRTKRSEVMLKTGPLMLDVAMGEYERSYVKREKDVKPTDKCYLAPPEEAMPSFDPAARGWFIFTCRRKQRVPEKRRHVCDELINRKFEDAPVPKTAYANHRWMHSWSSSHKPFDRKYRPKLTSSIHNIVDNVTLPSDKILDPTMETNPDES